MRSHCMTDAAVGRLLVASLHQSIADLLPTRLEFYESWLNPSGLREGRVVFTLRANASGTYTLPVRFVLSTP